jgi:NAD(P)-dependent dehydrogenase (short-subunit alcohol dehydrogenase family)
MSIAPLRPGTALVTGAAGGIGSVLVEELLDAGLDVVALGRQNEASLRWADGLADRPGFRYLAVNLGDGDAIDAACADLADAGVRIDHLINNAALQVRSELEELSPKHWDLVLRVNLSAAFRLSRQLAPSMAERGFGRIVNVSSLYSALPERGQSAYAASKGGLEALTRSIALDFAQTGVTCNVVSPGLIWHPNLEVVYTRDEFESLATAVPMARTGRPTEVTSAIRFLLGADASYITGQVIEINGGAHLR